MRNVPLVARVLGFVGVVAAPAVAYGASGYVHGQLKFAQAQGSYCPTSRDCTGARYLQSAFNSWQPVPEVVVYVQATGIGFIGQGTTDANGYFEIAWSYPTLPASAAIRWYPVQKDYRFKVLQSDASPVPFQTLTFTLVDGTGPKIPQELGTHYWGLLMSGNPLGPPTNPEPYSNVYQGAWMTWTYALSPSNRMLTYFTDVEILAFSNTVPWNCPTSCTHGEVKEIQLDGDTVNTAFSPQARVAHEMGHVASYLSSESQWFWYPANYNYGGADGVWYQNSAEWSSSTFEEGFATFVADAALYEQNAVAPHSCFAAQAQCTTGFWNIEASNGRGPPPTGSCASTENRWELSAERYLWDAFDSHIDVAYYTDSLTRNIWEFYDTIYAFPDGLDNRQKNEPYGTPCLFSCPIDDLDGRSAVDFYWNWYTWGTDSVAQYWMNCAPLGG